MNNLTEFLKQHIWCVITIAAIMLLAIITLSFGKDVNLVSHLSLTSAVVSVILAIIVIVYMYFQDQRSSQYVTDMRRLVDQASRAMTDKADLMVDQARSLEQMMSGVSRSPAYSDTTSTPLVLPEGGTFDVSLFSNIALITLYSLVKSHELRKTVLIDDVIEVAVYKSTDLSSFAHGLIQSLQAFLGVDYVGGTYNRPEVKKLPDGLKEAVTANIEERLKRYRDDSDDKSLAMLKDVRDQIDDYFNTL